MQDKDLIWRRDNQFSLKCAKLWYLQCRLKGFHEAIGHIGPVLRRKHLKLYE